MCIRPKARHQGRGQSGVAGCSGGPWVTDRTILEQAAVTDRVARPRGQAPERPHRVARIVPPGVALPVGWLGHAGSPVSPGVSQAVRQVCKAAIAMIVWTEECDAISIVFDDGFEFEFPAIRRQHRVVGYHGLRA